MRLVVDTNILISFFRENPVRFIIINPQLFSLGLYSPEHCWKELLNIKPSISKYSKVQLKQVDSIFEELKEFVIIIPDESSISFKSKAEQLTHDKDIPVFALALKLDCAVWSNEPGFKQQPSVKVFNTQELKEDLGFE